MVGRGYSPFLTTGDMGSISWTEQLRTQNKNITLQKCKTKYGTGVDMGDGKDTDAFFSLKSLGVVEAAAGAALKPSKQTPSPWTFPASHGHWKL